MGVCKKIEYRSFNWIERLAEKLRIPLHLPDIFSRLDGGNFFSKSDLLGACLQVKVDEECSKLQTINTHKSLNKLNRLRFGLKVTPSLFQQIMDIMLGRFRVCHSILRRHPTKERENEPHREYIKAVFQKIDEYGFKLGPKKCNFLMKYIKYLGQMSDKNGSRPDPE